MASFCFFIVLFYFNQKYVSSARVISFLWRSGRPRKLLHGIKYAVPGIPATLDRVAAITRRRKASWFGIVEPCLHPLLRAMPYPRLKAFFAWIMKDVIKKQNFPTVLTNMGPIDEESITFGGLRPDRAFLLVPPIYPPMIGIGLSGCRGALTLSAGVPQSTAPLIEDLFDQILEELPE